MRRQKAPVKPKPKIEPNSLTIDRPINDKDIWWVQVTGRKGMSQMMPCRESTLQTSYDASNDAWMVVVKGRWIDGDAMRFERFEETT